MLRSKLLCFLISGALLFTACSDLGTDSDPDSPDGDNGEDTEEPVEPKASVSNPGDGSTLEGDVVISVTGEAENGFDEVRISLGGEIIETISNPSLPFEDTLKTYNYENGTYDLGLAFDVTDQDTMVGDTLSVSLENYMVELETDGYIAALNQQDNLIAQYMYVADYEGNVLRAIELTSRSDGTIQLLPPEAIEGDAPSEYSLTIADLQNFDFQGGSFEVF